MMYTRRTSDPLVRNGGNKRRKEKLFVMWRRRGIAFLPPSRVNNETWCLLQTVQTFRWERDTFRRSIRRRGIIEKQLRAKQKRSRRCVKTMIPPPTSFADKETYSRFLCSDFFLNFLFVSSRGNRKHSSPAPCSPANFTPAQCCLKWLALLP